MWLRSYKMRRINVVELFVSLKMTYENVLRQNYYNASKIAVFFTIFKRYTSGSMKDRNVKLV